MIDVDAAIKEELEHMVRVHAVPDWKAIEQAARLRSHRHSRDVVVAIAAALAATVVVAVAIAGGFGSFSAWLTGSPGKPASAQQQQEFKRATRSWRGFPATTQLRQVLSTAVGGAHYTLFGFRAQGSFCLRLVITGSPSGTQLACAPLAELRARPAPALVLAADQSFGDSGRMVDNGPIELRASLTTVSFGVLADHVSQVSVTHQTPAQTHTVVRGDAFLAISPGLSPFDPTVRITARAANREWTIPFARQLLPFAVPSSTLSPAPRGPSRVQHVVSGGAIRWFARRQPRGQAVPASVHHIVGVLPNVIFARMLTPSPSEPERIVLSIRPAGTAYFNGRLRNNRQVCAELIGGRYSDGGCWPAGRLFSTEPFTWELEDEAGGQLMTIVGVASDQVARIKLYAATGAVRSVPLHDNTYFTAATLADFPLRLVAYDGQGEIIGTKTFKAPAAIPGPMPALNGKWRKVLSDSAGSVYTVRSTTGGRCVGLREGNGSAAINCNQPLGPQQMSLSTGSDERESSLFGAVGSGIARVVLAMRSGRTITLVPVAGFVLAKLPTVSRDPSAGVARAEGVTHEGRVVATQAFRR